MSKRVPVIEIPQPKYPDMAVMEDGKLHHIKPRRLAGGAVEYDLSGLPEAVVAKAQACVATSLARLPALERDAAIVKLPKVKLVTR